jgi:hypothetical protein
MTFKPASRLSEQVLIRRDWQGLMTGHLDMENEAEPPLSFYAPNACLTILEMMVD